MEYKSASVAEVAFLAAADAERSLVLKFEYSVSKLI